MIRLTRFALFSFIFLLPIMPEALGIDIQGLPDVSVIRVVLFILIIVLVIGSITEPTMLTRIWNQLRKYYVATCLVTLFFAWRMVCSLMAPQGPMTILAAIRDTIYFVVPLLAAIGTIRGRKDIHVLVMVLLFSSCLASFSGMVEWWTGHSIYADLTSGDSSWNTRAAFGSLKYEGVLASFPNPLAFGAFLVGPIVISGSMIAFKTRKIVKALAIFVLSVCAVGVLLSTSRGAIASLLVALVFGLTLSSMVFYRRIRRTQKRIALAFIVIPFIASLALGLAMIGNVLIEGATAKQSSSSSMRLLQLTMSVPVISERPVLGYGVGQAAESLGMLSKTVDNYFLTVALECGIPGLILFLILIGYFSVSAAFSFLESRSSYMLVIAMYFAAASTQFLVLSLKQSIPLLFIAFGVFLVLGDKASEKIGQPSHA